MHSSGLKRLKAGDEVRVIAPSSSLAIISNETRQNAVNCLEKELGLRVTFSGHCEEKDAFLSSSINSRVSDLHEAFKDENVKAILTVLGGYNCNQLLDQLNYELIKKHPKIFCGYSDITALSNAIYQKTGIPTFSGPHFSTFGCLKGMEYTVDYFKKCLMSEDYFAIEPSNIWSDDQWYLDQKNRTFLQNIDGMFVINQGKAEGTIVGGNLCTLNLLHGTEYMPSLTNAILFIEDDYLAFPEIFDRDLHSLTMQPKFSAVQGMIIGRFQPTSKMTIPILVEICRRKKTLANIPIIANADFGHTMPMFTFPIGGKAKINTSEKSSLILEW